MSEREREREREPDVHSGVDSGISRGTLRNTGPIVDDVFIAARLPILVQHLSLLTLVVELLDLKTRKSHMKHMCLHQCMSLQSVHLCQIS